MNIAFIGGGNMGEAILGALIQKNICPPQNITVSEIKAERRTYLETSYGIKTTASNPDAIKSAEVVLLAIKPQNLPELSAELKGKLADKQLVISIIAGATLSKLSGGLAHKAVVRVMPNTPAMIGMGMSVWTALPSVSPTQKDQAKAILSAMGKEIYTGKETMLDAATAISGSGPAYFFLFMEGLEKAALEMGFTPEEASILVSQTAAGSAIYAGKSGLALTQLRKNVTSPGGTTAEAIKAFEEAGLEATIIKAAKAAFNRSVELGKG
ncbi:pyrroline-5-carboxylate reductase [Dehalococcoides mccartyi]|jgi:pyrroline-5-carboxylate reductase|uniref:Pyrroline-5-carboxylate reductase n=1 Tax=Dehalococcoides mccartyi TaxID=61435 RepID=A0A142V8T5_9CHLR|nr:pyrroline-5-carboxylate reductase [Dehalococcoides mccartyi]AII60391.1 pyrroline-5-carboxylate reductase [Dehalococcoides mccartyi CG5]AMU86031.1 pyrroline-5-carboxylate reductase [Dehalococcoides mccartyi]AOV98840.1 pyrroline-5-carboxylate reductase [Dehalococcoides mccartyi]MBA2084599.1 Pyrroline-5-carboxylate reductase [Dehalococcoides mccartyi]QBX63378.1 pyrroline-5-carboxylate reductase [Dehalococcoides mccartyi]